MFGANQGTAKFNTAPWRASKVHQINPNSINKAPTEKSTGNRDQ